MAIHEIVGHYGVDKILSPDDWKGIEDHVAQNGGALRDSIISDYASDATPRRVAREYVARVMSFAVIYDWRQHGDAVLLSQRLTPIGQTYTLPDSRTERKLVTCPAIAPPTPAEAGSAAPASSMAPPAASSSGTH